MCGCAVSGTAATICQLPLACRSAPLLRQVFDEYHFGKFVNNYNDGKYFFDIHPPLGKLTLAFAGWLVYVHGSGFSNYLGRVLNCPRPANILSRNRLATLLLYYGCVVE